VTESQFGNIFCLLVCRDTFILLVEGTTVLITMRFSKLVLLEVLAACHILLNPSPVRAFAHLSPNTVRHPALKEQQQQCSTFSGSATVRQMSNTAASTEDCRCADVMFAGDPSDRAKGMDARQAIRNSNIYRVSGEPVLMDDLLGAPESKSGVSIVVFMRSLG
jgi:hypothetical protein